VATVRIDPVHAEYFKASIRRFLPDAELYLFGSRARDELKGGDIDLLVLGPRELSDQEKRDIKIGFYKAFGERKIDIVSFTKDDPAPFKQLALMEAEKF
jgi:predicted nucleotidyltransferase